MWHYCGNRRCTFSAGFTSYLILVERLAWLEWRQCCFSSLEKTRCGFIAKRGSRDESLRKWLWLFCPLVEVQRRGRARDWCAVDRVAWPAQRVPSRVSAGDCPRGGSCGGAQLFLA